jgi:glycosyltransferase involved in cell wall biosynthesis
MEKYKEKNFDTINESHRRPLLSIVLPIFNEQKNIPVLYHELLQALQKINHYSYEIIFVDDGSNDNSWDVILNLSLQDEHIKGISFSRNFGNPAALMAGYDRAQGNIIVSMDSDMQHPPSLIPEMVKLWEEGAQIVYARRIDRHDTLLKKYAALLYHKVLSAISTVPVSQNVTDFRLLDRKILSIIKRSKENSHYLRGIIAWTGLKSAFVDLKYQERLHGTSGYTWKKLIRLALDGITGFSTFPLKISAFVGIFVVATGCFMFIFITYETFFRNAHYPLFKWLVTINYIFMGVQFFLMWLLGEYIGRIYDQLRDRPLYIVAQEVNMETEKSMPSFQPNKHRERQKEF